MTNLNENKIIFYIMCDPFWFIPRHLITIPSIEERFVNYENYGAVD